MPGASVIPAPILGARVIDAVHVNWPAVILAGLRLQKLVAAAGAVLGLPQFARIRIDGQPFFTAMAIRPDFGRPYRLGR